MGQILFSLFTTVILFFSSFAPFCLAADTAEAFRVRAAALEAQGKFLEAADLYEKGAHADLSRSGLARDISAAQHQRVADALSYAGLNYYKAGEYVKGAGAYKQGLEVLKAGRLERDIPLCLSSIAWGMIQLHQNEEGLNYLTEAVKAAKRSGMDRYAADYLNDKGQNLTAFGRYKEAIPVHEEAQKIYKKLGDQNAVANMDNNIGQAYRGLAQYEKALRYYRDAYELHKKIGKDAEAAVNMNNIGLVYESRGQYDRALQAYEEALAVYRKENLEQEIPTTVNNIGNVYFSWGQYSKALGYYEEALALGRKTGNEANTAIRLGSIGAAYLELGKYDEALKYFEECLSINRRLGRSDYAADTLTRIGSIYLRRWQHDKSLPYFEEALAIAKKTGNMHLRSTCLLYLGQVRFARKEYDSGVEIFQQALSLSRKIGSDQDSANILYNIGRGQFELKRYADADRSFGEAVAIKEKLRKTVPGASRRDFTARQIDIYQYLTSAEIRQSDFSAAVKSIELGKAKFLAEQLAGSGAVVPLQAGNDLRRELPDDTAVIMYANTNQRDKVIMAITRSELLGIEVANLELYDSKWSKYSDETTAGLAGARGAQLVDRDQKRAGSIELKRACSCDAVINYYRTLLIASGQRARGAAIRPQPAQTDDDEIRMLARLLYGIFVKPVEQSFKGKKRLIISTDGALGFLPFETLIDDSGKYLVETYEITYVQSMSVLELINKRKYGNERKQLLAFGGASYNDHEKNRTRGIKTAATSKAGTGSFRGRYAEIGLGVWSNLPYSLKEVQSLARIVPGADVYSGEQVTETMVKELDRKGDLSKYKVIHFATHGMVVPAYPELSALVLSRGAQDSGEDGYLRMEEIAKLRLKADFVNLSACDTGLGKLYEGEGVVSLAHAFLIAGANSISVSLWQVADESTSRFMTGMYEIAHKRNLHYAAAITEMKRKFIRGDFGAAYSRPYYWAPFVYYGR